jgi:hypothetical protein
MNTITEIQLRTNQGGTPCYSPNQFAEAFREFLLGNSYKLMFTIDDGKGNLSGITLRQEDEKLIIYGQGLEYIQDFLEYSCEATDNWELLMKLQKEKNLLLKKE